MIAWWTGGAWVLYFADAPTLVQGSRDRPGAVRRLCLDRHSDLHDLCARRPHARAGLPLHVPVAAHPGGADRRICAQRHLSLRPRRAARLGQEGRAAARAGRSRPATASIACNASHVCPTGVDIRERRAISAASSAACASTPATRSWRRSAGRPRLIAYDTDLNIKRRGTARQPICQARARAHRRSMPRSSRSSAAS